MRHRLIAVVMVLMLILCGCAHAGSAVQTVSSETVPGKYKVMTGNVVVFGTVFVHLALAAEIAGKLENDEVAIIALAHEEDESILDQKLSGFKTIIARFDGGLDFL